MPIINTSENTDLLDNINTVVISTGTEGLAVNRKHRHCDYDNLSTINGKIVS